MKTKTFVGLCLMGLIAFVAFYNQDQAKKPEKIKNLQQEIPTLQLIKDAVLEKYVPDSLKDASRDASHDLMYADEGNNDYYTAKEQIWATEDYIKKSKPCRYIDSLLQAKEEELKELQN